MDFPPKSAIACIGVVLLGLIVNQTNPLGGSTQVAQASEQGQPGEQGNSPSPNASESSELITSVPGQPGQPDVASTPGEQSQTSEAYTPPTCLAPHIEHQRISGKNRFATAIAVSKKLYEARSEDHIVLASGANFPDAITALNTSEAGNATPILLAPAEGLTQEIEAELRRIATKDAKVTVLGGPQVISDAVIQQVQSFGYATKRIAGVDRVDTSLMLADNFSKPIPNKEFVVSPAGDYAVSLVAGVLAVSRNGSHVISHTDPKANNPVYQWIHDRNPYQMWVVGDGMSTGLANRSSTFIHTGHAPAVWKDMTYPESKCPSGKELLQPGPGQQTIAERVLMTHFRDATDIVVVDADSPVDGIAAGQLAAQYNAPILPLHRDINHINRYVGLLKQLGAKERMIHFVGGKRSISEEVRNHFVDYLSR